MQLMRPNRISYSYFGYKYFEGAQVAETETPFKHVNYLLLLIMGIAQSAVVEFIFCSEFCKKNFLKCFIFQLEQPISNGLRAKVLSGTVSVGRFVMVCVYVHTILGIQKCECIKRVIELIIKRLQMLKVLLSKSTTGLFKK